MRSHFPIYCCQQLMLVDLHPTEQHAGLKHLIFLLQTILSAGAALPVLIAGTGLGLAAGVTGGTAAVTEKVLKSRQMSVAKLALVR